MFTARYEVSLYIQFRLIFVLKGFLMCIVEIQLCELYYLGADLVATLTRLKMYDLPHSRPHTTSAIP